MKSIRTIITCSKQPSFCERHAGPVAYDEVIQYADVDKREGILESARDELVRSAGFRYARRMVVREDHGRSVMREGLLHHLTRMHAGAVDRAAEQFFEGNQAVAVIKVQTAEHLKGAVAQLRREKGAGGLRRAHDGTEAKGFAIVTSAKLEGRLHDAVARGPKSALAHEARAMQAEKCRQRAEFHEQMTRELDRRAPAPAGSQEHRQEVGFG